MASILVLADDLTGGLETAAKFAEHGFRVRLITQPASAGDEDVMVAVTASRHLTPERAAERVTAFASVAAQLIYKKTDSALRGNISAELGALRQVFSEAKISYIPSYPELGRTTVGGKLFIDAIPAHLSNLAQDSLSPIETSSVAELVKGIPCTIHDGQTPADVLSAVTVALSAHGPHLLAGPASVADAIATYLRPGKLNPQPPIIRKCLIVNGSRHQRSLEQIKTALDRGCLSDGWRVFSPPVSENLTASEFAAAAGAAVVQEIERTAPHAVLVFGGDTALGILEAMGNPDLESIGELLTGVPISKIANRGLYMISKAGSFGSPEVICLLKNLLYDR
jgi:uncharacterized protein YgbK (DUF1537 family)